jgi:hypothetical protein
MAKQQDNFSASARAAELVPSEVEVGDRMFKVKRTGKALKAIIAMAPDDDAADDPNLNIEMLYAGIAQVLVDNEGNHPDTDFLEENLDFQVAQELMEKFLPRSEEGNSGVSAEVTSTNGSPVQA